jgi:hypothetical protein
MGSASMTHDEELRALHKQAAEQEQYIQALLDATRELEREWAAKLAKLTPRERAIFEAELD